MPRIVALLTDFGARDPYAGATRGAVLAACPEANVVDISHELPAHDVAEAAFCLAASFKAFPAGTVFVAVVDPEVGSERRGIAIAAGGYLFVGPDNGIFTLVLAELEDRAESDQPGGREAPRVHELTNSGLFRHQVSPTFHARDVFAPVAGYLARGGRLEDVGSLVSDPRLLPVPPARHTEQGELEGVVLHLDRFGNLTSNIGRGELAAMLGTVEADPTAVVVVVEGVVLPFVRTYAEVPEGEICSLVGSSGRLEVAANRASAARLLGATVGSPVRMRPATTRGGVL